MGDVETLIPPHICHLLGCFCLGTLVARYGNLVPYLTWHLGSPHGRRHPCIPSWLSLSLFSLPPPPSCWQMDKAGKPSSVRIWAHICCTGIWRFPKVLTWTWYPSTPCIHLGHPWRGDCIFWLAAPSLPGRRRHVAKMGWGRGREVWPGAGDGNWIARHCTILLQFEISLTYFFSFWETKMVSISEGDFEVSNNMLANN